MSGGDLVHDATFKSYGASGEAKNFKRKFMGMILERMTEVPGTVMWKNIIGSQKKVSESHDNIT